MKWKTAIRFAWIGNEGTAAIELALLAPIYMLLLIGATDFGLALFHNLQVKEAVQAGALYAVEHGYNSNSISGIVTGATKFASINAAPAPSEFCGCPTLSGVASAGCSSTCSNGQAAGVYVTVNAKSTYDTILHYPRIPTRFSLSARSTVRIQ